MSRWFCRYFYTCLIWHCFELNSAVLLQTENLNFQRKSICNAALFFCLTLFHKDITELLSINVYFLNEWFCFMRLWGSTFSKFKMASVLVSTLTLSIIGILWGCNKLKHQIFVDTDLKGTAYKPWLKEFTWYIVSFHCRCIIHCFPLSGRYVQLY